MRNAFSEALYTLAESHDEVVLLYGDIGNKLFDNFKNSFPGRAINCGVAESNMVSVAAGLASQGFRPFVYTINSFLYLKALEQIKIDVCYTQLPVVFVGTGAALSYSALGTTHHSLEDVGVLRNLPNLQIFAPNSPDELPNLLTFVHLQAKPSYIRIGKKGELCLPFYDSVKSSQDFYGFQRRNKIESSIGIVLSYGTISRVVTDSLEHLERRGQFLDHFTITQIKDLDFEMLTKILCKQSKVIVVEEHFSNGGLLDAIYKFKEIGKFTFDIHGINVGIDFFVGLGELESARTKIGLDEKSISQEIQTFLGRY